MAARLRLLRAKRRAEDVDLAEGEGPCLAVELAALGEIGGLVEVRHREEAGRALARVRREDGCVEGQETVPVEVFATGADDLGAHAHDRLLAIRSEPEMAVIEEKGDAVLLRRDRILGGALDDVEIRHAELVSDRSARVGAHHAGHFERGFLREVIGERERFLRHVGLREDALDRAGPVAYLEEVELAARAAARQPAAPAPGAAPVLPAARDGRRGHPPPPTPWRPPLPPRGPPGHPPPPAG